MADVEYVVTTEKHGFLSWSWCLSMEWPCGRNATRKTVNVIAKSRSNCWTRAGARRRAKRRLKLYKRPNDRIVL